MGESLAAHDCQDRWGSAITPRTDPRGAWAGNPSAAHPICGEWAPLVIPSCCSRQSPGSRAFGRQRRHFLTNARTCAKTEWTATNATSPDAPSVRACGLQVPIGERPQTTLFLDAERWWPVGLGAPVQRPPRPWPIIHSSGVSIKRAGVRVLIDSEVTVPRSSGD